MGTLRALLGRQWRLFLHSIGEASQDSGVGEEAGRARAGGHPLHMHYPGGLLLDQVRHENSDGQAQALGGP